MSFLSLETGRTKCEEELLLVPKGSIDNLEIPSSYPASVPAACPPSALPAHVASLNRPHGPPGHALPCPLQLGPLRITREPKRLAPSTIPFLREFSGGMKGGDEKLFSGFPPYFVHVYLV